MEKATNIDENSITSVGQQESGKGGNPGTTEASHSLMATLNELVKEELQMIDDWVYSFELEDKLAAGSQNSSSGNEDSKSESWDEAVNSTSEDRDSRAAPREQCMKVRRREILE